MEQLQGKNASTLNELLLFFTNNNMSNNKKINEENILVKSLNYQCHSHIKHAKRVSKMAEQLAKHCQIDKNAIKDIKLTGLLHDIGKLGISEQLLNTPKKLTEEEFQIVQQHTKMGHQLLFATRDLQRISQYVLEHHERWDGTGYPNRLSKTNISLPARIVCITDSYDAMTSKRPYHVALTKKEAIEELKRCSGSQFDPELVDIFIKKVL